MNESIDLLRLRLHAIEARMHEVVNIHTSVIKKLPKAQQLSAINLLNYLALRNEDITTLQDSLHLLGLSSLSSAESHIYRQLQAILAITGTEFQLSDLDRCTAEYGFQQLRDNCQQLFGTDTKEGKPAVMVTFDNSFLEKPEWVSRLLENGMNIARINCAHDNEELWLKLIELLHEASQDTGIPCKLYMDLAGPKIRVKLLGKGRKDGKVKISEGETFHMVEKDAAFDKQEMVIYPNESGLIAMLKVGERVYFDDGLIKAEIIEKNESEVKLKVLRNSTKNGYLKNEKGINFPDSILNFSSLTSFDKQCLPFILQHADMIGYSFVRNPEDLAHLQLLLEYGPQTAIGVVIKIETAEAVQQLPALLLQGMTHPGFAVMIARGDLAVEIGFERLGEIQEEILWICEAAHTPVIWATQVLENLNKSGIATRAEITDVGLAAQADCIMINKGAYTIKVMETIKEVLSRNSGHHHKKRYRFRRLGIAAGPDLSKLGQQL